MDSWHILTSDETGVWFIDRPRDPNWAYMSYSDGIIQACEDPPVISLGEAMNA